MKKQLYRLDTGNAPFRVVGKDVYARTATVEYVKSGFTTEVASSRIVPYTEPETLKGATTMAKQLYRVIAEADVYGILLTKNSTGQLVLEMKGSGGAVRAFAASELEEVMPFTFDVQFLSGGRTYSYLGTAGTVAEGDLLLQDDGQYATVIEIDSKSRQADKTFSGWKLDMATRLDGKR